MMRESTRLLARRAACAFALVAVGCQSATDVNPRSAEHGVENPGLPRADQLRMSAQWATPDCPQPDQVLSPGPAVVVTDVLGRRIAGVTVEFHAASDAQVEHATAITGSDGVASAGAWHLAAQPGMNSMTASITGGPSTRFTINANVAARVIAVFDLVSIGGKSLPLTYPVVGSVDGGHYVLADNGTYEFQYDRNGASFSPPDALCSQARYVAAASRIDFYLAPGSYPMSTFYQDRDGHFATATLSGQTMSVKYEDFIDFEDEVYQLVAGSPSLLDSWQVAGPRLNVSPRAPLRPVPAR